MKELQIDSWKHFKEICVSKKKLNLQCLESDEATSFHVFAVEGQVYWFVNLVLDEDIKEFKSKFWKGLNKRISGK